MLVCDLFDAAMVGDCLIDLDLWGRIFPGSLQRVRAVDAGGTHFDQHLDSMQDHKKAESRYICLRKEIRQATKLVKTLRIF